VRLERLSIYLKFKLTSILIYIKIYVSRDKFVVVVGTGLKPIPTKICTQKIISPKS